MSSQLVLLLGVIAIYAGLMFVVLAFGATASDRQQVGRSLAALDAISSRRDEVRRELDRPFAERVLGPIVTRLSRIGSQFSPARRDPRSCAIASTSQAIRRAGTSNESSRSKSSA